MVARDGVEPPTPATVVRAQEIVSVEELELELKSAHSCMDPKDT